MVTQFVCGICSVDCKALCTNCDTLCNLLSFASLVPKPSHRAVFDISFFISAVRLWNSLPGDIVLLDSLSLFKSSLKFYLCI